MDLKDHNNFFLLDRKILFDWMMEYATTDALIDKPPIIINALFIRDTKELREEMIKRFPQIRNISTKDQTKLAWANTTKIEKYIEIVSAMRLNKGDRLTFKEAFNLSKDFRTLLTTEPSMDYNSDTEQDLINRIRELEQLEQEHFEKLYKYIRPFTCCD